MSLEFLAVRRRQAEATQVASLERRLRKDGFKVRTDDTLVPEVCHMAAVDHLAKNAPQSESGDAKRHGPHGFEFD